MNHASSHVRRTAWAPETVLCILAVATGVIARFWAVWHGPGQEFAVDQLFDRLAWNLVSLHQFTLDGLHPAAHVGPLYPAALALFYAGAGHRPEWVPFLHIGFDMGTAWCVYRVGALVYGARVGAWAASFFLLYPAYWTYDGRIRSEALFTLLVSLWVLLTMISLRSPSGKQWAAVGIAAGLTMLCKPVVLVLAVMLAGLVWFDTPSLRHKMLWTGVYVLTCAVIVAPWTIRNYRAFQEVIPVSAGMGAGLWMGSDPVSHGSWPMTPEQEAAIWERAGIAPLAYAHAMYDVPADRVLREKGWTRIAADPFGYVTLVVIRVWDFWVGNTRYLVNSERGFMDGLGTDAAERGWLIAIYSLVKRLLLVPGLVVLACWSVWWDRARWRTVVPLSLFPFGLTAGYVPFTVEAGRYALPVLPCLIVLSAALVVRFLSSRTHPGSEDILASHTGVSWHTN